MAYNIAIDGPAGSGKSSIAKLVAKHLNLTYVDTGAMYRAVAWKLKEINATEEAMVKEVINDFNISFDANNKVCVDDKSLSMEIRTVEITRLVPIIAAMPVVREKLKHLQRKMVEDKNVIMDGRDIGTIVIPDAEFKFYLDADPKIRAQRRYDQMNDAEKAKASLDDIIKDVMDRDHADMTREVGPLKKADDAITIDSSHMTIEEVIKAIEDKVKKG